MVASSESSQLDNPPTPTGETRADAEIRRYQAEMQLVQAELEAMVEALEGPLRSLVRSQVRATMPPVRAAIALASGVIEEERTRVDGHGVNELRSQRIHLAVALEMLATALNTHRLLILGDAAKLDRSILGGTILAGDYCFSRSADMAVKTDSPQVVALFATALKAVSEGSLRYLFDESDEGGYEFDDNQFDDNTVLYHTAAAAAAALIHAPDSMKEILFPLASGLAAARRREDAQSAYSELRTLILDLPARQQARWKSLLAWLFTHQGDGGIRPLP